MHRDHRLPPAAGTASRPEVHSAFFVPLIPLLRSGMDRAGALRRVGGGLRLLAAVLVGAIAPSARALTLDHTGWFKFYMPWNDTARTATDLSWSLPRPAGASGFLEVAPGGTFRFSGAPERVRFTGFVNVAEANFPDSVDAILAAGRLAKLGINLVRVHLVDVDDRFGLFANSALETRTLDAQRLRRMDWFLACLRDRGIYYNFAVQSGRRFKDGDGIAAPVTNDQSKYVTLFDPRLIALQKEFARSIAAHVNPFTGLAYAADPAVATWELTNENQMYLGWLSWGAAGWDSLSTAHPAGMHPYYHRELDTLWNRWLASRHADDAALAAAWTPAGSGAEELVGNGSFEASIDGWAWWSDAAAGAGITVDHATDAGYDGEASLRVRVDSQGTQAWSSSLNYTGLSATKGTSYRLRFRIRGTEPSSVQAEFLREGDWKWYGATTCATDTEWSICEAFATPTDDLDGDLRFNLDFGLSSGTFWIDSVSFRLYGGEGLRAGESMASSSVRRSSRSTVGSLSAARAADESRFYSAVESAYVADLGGFLRDTLGIRVPVTFTNNWYGAASIASQARADYIDAHWYWDHPSFPDGWSNTAYSMRNQPMVRDAAGSTAASFSLSRVKGLPFAGSEYNHPWPNQYLCEAPAFYYGYLGFLDADMALLHAYADYTLTMLKAPYIEQFFSVNLDPVLLSQMPLARVFRMGGVAPTRSWRDVAWTDSATHASARRLDARPDIPARALLQTPMRWTRFDAAATSMSVAADPGDRVVSNTGELDWDGAAGILRVDNPSWQGLVGFLAAGASTARLAVRELRTTGGRNFAAVHLVAADSSPIESAARLLLLTSARVENGGTVWNSSSTALTRRFSGATDTVICEPVTGTVSIRIGASDSVSVYALDARGARVRSLPVSWRGDTLSFTLPGGTLWYEIARNDPTSAVEPGGAGLRVRAGSFRVRPGAPGHFQVAWDLPEPFAAGQLRATLLDASGRALAAREAQAAAGSLSLAVPGRGVYFVRVEANGREGARVVKTLRVASIR